MAGRWLTTRATPTRTFLGVSLGVTASALTFSVVAWPVADLWVAPWLIVHALNGAAHSTGAEQGSETTAACAHIEAALPRSAGLAFASS
jgi:hypothetical protein